MKANFRLVWMTILAPGLGLNLFGAEPAPVTSSIATAFTAVSKGDNVLVRGLPALRGDRLAKLKKGDAVNVMETVTLAKPAKDEPAQWYKIALPPGVGVWVNPLFVDTNQMTVKVKTTLNLRAGPGEEYNKLGLLKKGAAIKQLSTKNGWLEIEAPAEAYAFVAASFFTRKEGGAETAAPVIASTTPTAPATEPKVEARPETPLMPTNPPPVEVALTNSAVAVAPPVTVPSAEGVMGDTNAAAIAAPPVVVPPPVTEGVMTPPAATTNAAVDPVVSGLSTGPDAMVQAINAEVEPPPRRIVTREGILRQTLTVNTPSWYVLKSLDNGKVINYLHVLDVNLNLSSMLNKRVSVTGEEAMDKRWPRTPVIAVEKIAEQ